MTLIPYMAAFIMSTIAWSAGRKVGGLWLGSVAALVGGILAFYYTRKYMKNLLNG
jgi:putative Mn2+ efflux pump MntP